jgi:hypothetical protein
MCYRRNLISERPFDPRWHFVLDLDAMRRFILAGHIIVGTSTIAYRYRRHGMNQTQILGTNFQRHDEELRFSSEVAWQAAQLGWTATMRTARRAAVIRSNLVVDALVALTRRDMRRARGALQRAVRGLPSSK